MYVSVCRKATVEEMGIFLEMEWTISGAIRVGFYMPVYVNSSSLISPK